MRIRSRFLIRALGTIGAFCVRLLMRTVRTSVVTARPASSPYEDCGDVRRLFCLWHDGLVGLVFCRPAFRVAALVSRHTDGSYLSDAMQSIGITPIRGSSRRGGAEALKQMLAAAAEYHIAIATDGPQGPRRTVKEGVVFLASQTGRGIIPTAFAAASAVRIPGRWSEMVVPLPFSRTLILASEPIFVPPGLSRTELEPYRVLVQQAMDAVSAEADRRIRAGKVSATSGSEVSVPRRKAA